MERFPRIFKVLSASFVLGLVLAIGSYNRRMGR